MTDMGFWRVVFLAVGYVCGCFQTAYVVGRITHKVDIRDYGSKNAGTTNTVRVLGAKYGVVVFAGDVLKVFAAMFFVLIIALFTGLGTVMTHNNDLECVMWTGLGVVLGHNFPAPLRFKGGKGIASTVGVILCLGDWRIIGIIAVIAISILVVTRFMSLTSLTICLLFFLLTWVFGYPLEVVGIAGVLCALGFFLHRGNISRLARGEERKFSLSGNGILRKSEKK